MRKSEPGKLGDILRVRLGERNLTIQVDSAYICAEAKKILPEDAFVKSFKAGTLKVYAPSQARATILALQKNTFIGQINVALGTPRVQKIIFQTPTEINN